MKVCGKGQLTESVEALDRLVQRAINIDSSVIYGILKRLQKRIWPLEAESMLLQSRVDMSQMRFLANHIICMYASHGRLLEAIQVFIKVVAPNRFMWASIILAHARHGHPAEAIRLYQRMRQSTLKPDNRIFVAVLKACATAQDVGSGREVHADILEKADLIDTFVGNGLVDMYVKCGSLEDAHSVFDQLPTRDVVTWTAMIAGYAQRGLGDKALTLYSIMQQEGLIKANEVTYVCLLQACASIGALHQGKRVHAQIVQRGLEADLAVGT